MISSWCGWAYSRGSLTFSLLIASSTNFSTTPTFFIFSFLLNPLSSSINGAKNAHINPTNSKFTKLLCATARSNDGRSVAFVFLNALRAYIYTMSKNLGSNAIVLIVAARAEQV